MDGAPARAEDGADTGLTCEQAEHELRLHAQGGLPAERAQLLRAHLVRCSACAASFRETVLQRARLGRALRPEAPDTAGDGSGARLPVTPSVPVLVSDGTQDDGALSDTATGDGAGGTDAAPARRARRFRLRTLLLPAFFTWLILQIAGVDRAPSQIQVLEARGRVQVAERSFAEYEQVPLLLRGAWCHTEEGSSATLAAGEARLELGAWTSVQGEGTEPLRVRLRAGELAVRGDATVVTWIGVLDFEAGAGHVRLLAGGLELACEAGSVDYVGPLGERRLAAGERVTLRR